MTKYSTKVLIVGFVLTILLACKASQTSLGATGSIVLDLPPGINNSRNGEGDFLTLEDGRILFIYTRFLGEEVSDHAPAQLMSRQSKDGGKTWTKQDRLKVDQEGDWNVMSVSLLRLNSGHIALFYMRKNSLSDCLYYMRTSDNEGESWSDPELVIKDRQSYFVTNNDRIIKLNTGRIVVPVSRHKTKDTPYSNKGKIWCYYSNDDGKSWNSSEEVPTPDSVITQEPGLVELEDGRIMMIIRASGGFQWQSHSDDMGVTWSKSVSSDVKSPISPASMQRISNGDIILIWNNNGASGPGYFKAKRTPLTVGYSTDETASWVVSKDLEPDPEGFYCYAAIHEVDGYILLSDVRKIVGDNGLGAYIRRIRLDDIYGKQHN